MTEQDTTRAGSVAPQEGARDEVIAELVACLCKNLDPCCTNNLAVTACQKLGHSNPITIAILACVFCQWWDQSHATRSVAQYAMAPPPAAAASCTNLLPVLVACFGADFAGLFRALESRVSGAA
jgi:hypothetical protein